MENLKKVYIIFAFVFILSLYFIFNRTFMILAFDNKTINENYIDDSNSVNSIKKQIPSEFKKSFEKYLILKSEYEKLKDDSKISVNTANNFKQTLDYMKKTSEIADVKTFNYDFSKYTTVILSLRNFSSIRNMIKLNDFIENGGNVLIAIAPEYDYNFKNIYKKFGIKKSQNFIKEDSMTIIDNLFLKSKDLIIEQSNIILGVDLNPKCKVYAVSTESKIPMLWTYQYKKGKIIMFNGTSLSSKDFRGFASGMVSLLGDNYIYPIMNLKVLYIDDFPAPSIVGENSDIRKKYGTSISDFYRNIWWADILKTANKYDIKYTSVLIENYNNRILPPYNENTLSTKQNLILYGKELLKSGGEIGIHGYNHQPLAMIGFIKDKDLGYLPWNSHENMVEAMNSVWKFSKKVYPDYHFSTYVPPSNIMSVEGRKALKEGIPSIKTISSVYIEASEPDDGLIQEFDYAKDGIVDFPRISSGYFLSMKTKWSIYNAIGSIGIFSHFIHPDDILDKERNNNKTWEEINKEYQVLLNTMSNEFAWMRSVKASEASSFLKDYYETSVYINYSKNKIDGFIDNTKSESFFILRTEKTILKNINCKSQNIDSDFYLISTKQNKFSLILSEV